jgi:hypothetical protein
MEGNLIDTFRATAGCFRPRSPEIWRFESKKGMSIDAGGLSF